MKELTIFFLILLYQFNTFMTNQYLGICDELYFFKKKFRSTS